MTTAEQTVTAWAIVGISWVVMGAAGLDLPPQLEAVHQRVLGTDANTYVNVLDRRFWQRGIGMALIVSGTAVTVVALIRIYLFTRP